MRQAMDRHSQPSASPAVLRRALGLFDRVIVALAQNVPTLFVSLARASKPLH